MIKFFQKSILLIFVLGFVLPLSFVGASSPVQQSELFITPRFANFLVGSTFEAGIYLDTKSENVNAVTLKMAFDPKKLAVVNPSGGKSIFGIWIDPPVYDNTKGTLSFSGVIPEGIVSSSGLVGTITFKALTSGPTTLKILPTSNVLLNDGLGSETKLFVNKAEYTLNEVPSDGVVISSVTHPSPDHWYNNNNPLIEWEVPKDSSGFGVTLDSNPHAIPSTEVTTTLPYMSFKNVADGVWYVHVRSNIKNIWLNTSHFGLKIDTTPPEMFQPKASVLDAASMSGQKKYVILFSTTDALSGVEHYEVGVVNKNSKVGSLPIFIQTESPYVITVDKNDAIQVIVRAFDQAGNLREAYVNLEPSVINIIYIIIGSFLLLLILLHYLFGHRLWKHFKRAYAFFKKDSANDFNQEVINANQSNVPTPQSLPDQNRQNNINP